MKHHEFKAFKRKNSSENEIRLWIDGLGSVKAKAKIERIIAYLEVTLHWPVNLAHKLSGQNIWELRIIYNDTQYRPLGCFGPGMGEFTLLVGAIEIGDKLFPRSAIETANQRVKLIKEDRSLVDDF